MGNALGRGWGVRIPNDTYTHSPIGAVSSQAGYPPAYNISSLRDLRHHFC